MAVIDCPVFCKGGLISEDSQPGYMRCSLGVDWDSIRQDEAESAELHVQEKGRKRDMTAFLPGTNGSHTHLASSSLSVPSRVTDPSLCESHDC